MELNRRKLLASTAYTVAGATAVRSTRARAASVSLKCGIVTPDTHPLSIRLREAADQVSKDTNGDVDVAIFSNGQLGSDADMLSQLRSGALELFAQSSSNLATLVPRSSIVNVGFAWPDYQKIWPAVDGELGEYIRSEIANAGLVPFDTMWDNGFRQTTTSVRPINVAGDLAGLKLRVPNSALFTSLFKALGAAPVAMSFSEAYSALQTKIVDGQENPLSIIQTFKLAEVQRYLSFTKHVWDGFWLMSGSRTWPRISQDVRTVLTTRFNAAALVQRKDIEESGTALRSELQRSGFVVNDTQPASFLESLRGAGFFSEWKKKYGNEAWGKLEKFAGEIT